MLQELDASMTEMIRYGVLVLHAPEGLEVQVRAAVYLNLHRRTRSHFDFHRICVTLTSTRAAESALCSCHRAGLGGTEGLRHEGEADGTVRWSVDGNCLIAMSHSLPEGASARSTHD